MISLRLRRGEEMYELEPDLLTLSIAPMNFTDDAPGRSQGAVEEVCHCLWEPGAWHPEKKWLEEYMWFLGTLCSVCFRFYFPGKAAEDGKSLGGWGATFLLLEAPHPTSCCGPCCRGLCPHRGLSPFPLTDSCSLAYGSHPCL